MKLHLRRRSALLLSALAAIVPTTLALTASTADASARIVIPPSTISCYGNAVGVEAPRVYTNGTNDAVLWVNQLQRYDGRNWQAYAKFANTGGYNYAGQGTQGWSSAQLEGFGAGTFFQSQRITGDFLGNGQLHLSVQHTGYYRVYSIVYDYQGGTSFAGYVNAGNWCQVR